ncbi:MAG: hypothetical protein ACRDTT_29515, partial [Pseudonocardiaceae bacterium]
MAVRAKPGAELLALIESGNGKPLEAGELTEDLRHDRVVAGVIAGGLFRLVIYHLSGGRREFTSMVRVGAPRYDVLADEEVADEALRSLG